MDLTPRTEIILSPSQDTLSCKPLDGNPQPGSYIEIEGQTYLVLERRHRYSFKAGRYELHQIVLYVQKSQVPIERSLINGQWIIGDSTCQYNAHSAVLRCAVNPSGPCDRCRYFEPRDSTNNS